MGFWDMLTGEAAADASRSAASDTYNKQQNAIGDIKAFGNDYAAQFRDMGRGYDPYVQGGQSALQRLMAGLGLSGGQQGQQNFNDAYRNTPGYQAGLQGGIDAVGNSASARSMTNSGRTLKDLMRFGSDYEDQRVGNYMTKLGGLAGSGMGALGAQNATIGTGLQGQLGTRNLAFGGGMQSAGTIGQGDIAGANAESAGAQNLLNTGMKLAGMAFGGMGGGGLSSLMGGGAAGSSFGPMPMGATRIPAPGEVGFKGWG